MTEMREHLADVIFKTKAAKLDKAGATALADAIVNGLERRSLIIADVCDVIEPPDEHLRTLKVMRKRIREAVDNSETAARDLASLTRRLQDVSREVTTIEERYRGEMSKSKGKTNGHTASAAASTSGSLDI